MTTDAQLVAAARKDPDAFAELYRRHVHAVHAFLCLLHEKTLSAAEATSPVPVRIEQGALCTPSELTHAEAVALATLRAQFPAGTNVDSTKSAVDSAVQAAFAGSACRGLERAGEQARLVYAGIMPAWKLMPDVER
jgi:N-methylhydantoinase B/oxoprolinase/acetone carboxylase alpha subunit